MVISEQTFQNAVWSCLDPPSQACGHSFAEAHFPEIDKILKKLQKRCFCVLSTCYLNHVLLSKVKNWKETPSHTTLGEEYDPNKVAISTDLTSSP